MSKYISKKGEIEIEYPPCTNCEKYKDSTCSVYGEQIPKEITFEHEDCKYCKK